LFINGIENPAHLSHGRHAHVGDGQPLVFCRLPQRRGLGLQQVGLRGQATFPGFGQIQKEGDAGFQQPL